jgi:PAS domain S-box-containing protein
MKNEQTTNTATIYPSHPRTLGWFGTSALAMGGSNQSIFIIGALFAGQGNISGQGSAAIILLMVGVLLGCMSVPGWIELLLMYPKRVGGIAATCAEAFRPYNPILANLAGICYWWGWVPTSGLCSLLIATAVQHWYYPQLPVIPAAIILVILFTIINLLGVKWAAKLAIPIASISAILALISGLSPLIVGSVDWHQATNLHLNVPFPGWFGEMTSVMAGLFLIGFVAPAFETAACHVGEMINPEKNIPRTMLASAAMACLFFIPLPLIWLGVLGPEALTKDLAQVLGPTFAPVFGASAKAVAVWFMLLNLFLGGLQPLSGAPRTLSQISEDGLIPRIFSSRSKFSDVPWFATLFTAGFAIFFLYLGDPIWLIAATNFTYVFGGLVMPSIAVWLLRRDAPDVTRIWRAPKGTIVLGLIAATTWAITALLGFQQFGLSTVIVGLVFAYSGSVLYVWRRIEDNKLAGLPNSFQTLHVKLTGAMLLVLFLDGAGYYIAVSNIPHAALPLLTVLEDIFVLVAFLTVAVGLVLPGMIAFSAHEVSNAAIKLSKGTVRDFAAAMKALGEGNLELAHAHIENKPIKVTSKDELGQMIVSFNELQNEITKAAHGLDAAREGLSLARSTITNTNAELAQKLSALRLSEERMKIAAESGQVAVWEVDLKTDKLNWDDTSLSLYKTQRENFTGTLTDWVEKLHPDDLLSSLQAYQDAIRGVKEYNTEYRIICSDGEIRHIKSHASIMKDDSEVPVRLVGISWNITEQKQVESAILSAKLAAEDASKAKSNFLANMSHELRTPMNAILGFAQVLEYDETLNADQLDSVNEIHKGGKHLLQLINEVLDLAKIESGQIEIALELVDVASIVEECIALVSSLGAMRNITITHKIEQEIRVLSDRTRLKQVLLNLLSNAIKYNVDGGNVVVDLQSINSNSARIYVKDTGLGIPAEKLEELFQPFNRLNAENSGIEGTGIGLTITKRIVELMGGKIGVESTVGAGSSFWIELRLNLDSTPLSNELSILTEST